MKNYPDITPTMRAILMMYNKGYTHHISFKTSQEKLPQLEEKWAIDFGTKLPAHTRFARKQRGHANAVAYSGPVFSEMGMVQVILMATEEAIKMPPSSPWSREKWLSRYPEFSKFVMVEEQRERGDRAMTWRIQNRDLEELRKYLVALTSSGDSRELKRQTEQIVRIYPMFGGVRRQLRRMLREMMRLWNHHHKDTQWPGPDPESLPMSVGFKRLAGKTD
ncbi:MAG: hypothetical protein M0Z78_05100 [Betaproteobacteria bacterium]|nr:hypothetical protein [Betaproteobacteria bacterium]